MWTVIIIAIISLITIIGKYIYDGEFIKGNHSHNFSIFVGCILLATIITLGGVFVTFCGTGIALNINSELPYILVDTENYYLAELTNDKYISISSNEYNYATIEDKVIHYQQTTATDDRTIKIVENIYLGDEKPVVSIEHYKVGGTFFWDNFTFSKWLSNSYQMTFYIPEGSVGTYIAEVK